MATKTAAGSTAIEALLKEKRKFPPEGVGQDCQHQSGVDLRRGPEEPAEILGAVRQGVRTGSSRGRRRSSGRRRTPSGSSAASSTSSDNCLDRHIHTARRTKAALIWEGEPGDSRTLTYWDLYREVNRFAAALKRAGVKKGDRVTIYMPMVPETAIAMLACARIGAPHSVIFGGFAPEAVRERIHDAESTVLITADGGFRRGGIVPLKKNVDDALTECPDVRTVVVLKRTGQDDPYAGGPRRLVG